MDQDDIKQLYEYYDIEYYIAACRLFQINIRTQIKTKLLICKDYHIQPSEIDRMPYFEYEYMLEDIKEITDKQSVDNEEQEKKYASMQSNMNPEKYMSSLQGSLKTPSLPQINVPKF